MWTEERTGYVYFIGCGGTEWVKIGWGYAPTYRLMVLQVGCPMELRLLATVPAERQTEGMLQEHFKADCVRGEWFTSTPRLRRLIALLAKTGVVEDEITREVRAEFPVLVASATTSMDEARKITRGA